MEMNDGDDVVGDGVDGFSCMEIHLFFISLLFNFLNC